MKYDVLIVGAGLAGCACARQLARAGARVLVIDRADLVAKDKLCGGLLTPRAVEVVERLYGSEVQALYRQTHRRMRVLFGEYDEMIEGICLQGVQRRQLDRFALDKALDAGVDVLDRIRVCSIDIVEGRILCATDQGSVQVGFDVLVGADGANSYVRRMACAQCNIAGRRRGAQLQPQPFPLQLVPSLEVVVQPSEMPSGRMPFTAKYDAHVHGYGWYIPCGHQALIGYDSALGVASGQLHNGLHAFADELGVTFDPADVRGAFIPRGDAVMLHVGAACDIARRQRLALREHDIASFPRCSIDGCGTEGSMRCGRELFSRCPVYLIGDAAGLAAPATGEGIYFAVRSAELLSESLVCNQDGEAGLRYFKGMLHDMVALNGQYRALGVLFNESLMDAGTRLAAAAGIPPSRMARLAMRMFASF